MNSVFIHQEKHHGFLSLIKATSGDIVDLCLGKWHVVSIKPEGVALKDRTFVGGIRLSFKGFYAD
jgi:hypothetical protein